VKSNSRKNAMHDIQKLRKGVGEDDILRRNCGRENIRTVLNFDNTD